MVPSNRLWQWIGMGNRFSRMFAEEVEGSPMLIPDMECIEFPWDAAKKSTKSSGCEKLLRAGSDALMAQAGCIQKDPVRVYPDPLHTSGRSRRVKKYEYDATMTHPPLEKLGQLVSYAALQAG